MLLSGEPAINSIPCLEDLPGDKLTAFAHDTTGISYFKKEDSRSMEIIKQLYDVGNLFDVVSDLEVIKTTFHQIAHAAIIYRQVQDGTPATVQNDISQTALCLSVRGAVEKENFEHLKSGIQQIERFIFSEKCYLNKAITHA